MSVSVQGATYKITKEELVSAARQLAEFVAIPSVSNINSPDYNKAHIQDAADYIEIIMPGVEDPKCSAHSHNESQDLGLLARAINSLISFIHMVGKG